MQHLPVVAMTAYAMKGDKDLCLEAGCDGYVSKPIDSRTLYETVEGLAAAGKVLEAVRRVTSVDIPSGQADAVWDASGALAKLDGDLPFLKEMAQLFVSSCPKLVAALEVAVRAGDAVSIRKAAHAIKGNVAIFCAETAFEQALLLETKGKNGDLDGLQYEFKLLQSRLDVLEHALVTFVNATVTAPAAAAGEALNPEKTAMPPRSGCMFISPPTSR